MIATSYFPRMIQLIVREVMEITPRPDSIPFKPASILVRLEQIETAIGIKIIYKRPTLGGAIIFFGILLLGFGHGLNMILNVLSVIVHGVRLNTLEFSSHLGMSWSGFSYKPFAEK